MSTAAATPPVKYHVQISPVREVTLFGAADLDFWKRHLADYDLHPADRDGRAEILVSSVDAKFMGLRFREMSISVAVSRRAGGGDRDGYFLAHAWNSIRFFAFIERTMFSTPYYHGNILVEPRLPAASQVSRGNQVLLRVAMAADAANRTPLRSGEEIWEGPIYLPQKRPDKNDPGKVFFAKLAGHAHNYPFTPADTLTLHPTLDCPVLAWLVESHFAGREWLVREAATHGKSKTVKRGTLPAG